MKTLLFSFMLLLAVPLSTNCQSERVYICTGSSSKVYHRTSYCRGLNNCRASVKAVSKATAVQMGRVPCKICYWYSGVCGDSFCVCCWPRRSVWSGTLRWDNGALLPVPELRHSWASLVGWRPCCINATNSCPHDLNRAWARFNVLSCLCDSAVIAAVPWGVYAFLLICWSGRQSKSLRIFSLACQSTDQSRSM